MWPVLVVAAGNTPTPPQRHGTEAALIKTRWEQGAQEWKVPYGQNQGTWVTEASAYPPITTGLQQVHHSPPAAASTMRGAL